MSLFRTLSLSEGGKRLILNIYDGAVAQSHLPLALVRHLVRRFEALAALPGGKPWHPHLPTLEHIVFKSPDLFQYRGPAPAMNAKGRGRWMTIKTASDIGQLILQSPWSDAVAMKRRFRPYDLGVMGPKLSDFDCETFAAIVNDPRPPIRFRLAKVIGARPVPVWLSRWCTMESKYPDLLFPSARAAKRIRDWLGLPNEGDPLFAIRARAASHASRYLARRPTALDGISNVLFKHRVVPPNGDDGCGATADIDLLKRPPGRPPDNVDGGPELVGRRFWFHPKNFECVYIGRAPMLGYDLWGDFHQRLLNGRDLPTIVQAIEDALG